MLQLTDDLVIPYSERVKIQIIERDDKAIKEIEEYQKKCTEEISQVSYGRGGREIGEFENPIKIERRELNESSE